MDNIDIELLGKLETKDKEELIDPDTGHLDVALTLKKLREMKGMSRNEFCKYLGIPYRTLQDWELGNRTMPSYTLRLIAYAVVADILPRK